jgi:hypothetical protein
MDDLDPTEPLADPVDEQQTFKVSLGRDATADAPHRSGPGTGAPGLAVPRRRGIFGWRNTIRGWFARDVKRMPDADPARVAVTIQSRPTGAFVTVVTDGTVSPLGPTPLTALLALDRSLDVVVCKEGFVTELRRVPKMRTHLIVFHLRRVT